MDASPASAWRSVLKVSSTTFDPGDVIRFKRGETWELPYDTSLDFIGDSGDPGNPITVTAYGPGSAPIISAIEDISAG
ncbi:MAG: hypothetical protein GY800_07465, partial [Planctomycetes bacterium]|nr:hypothetical protein [Planctomycetota bacterium]